MPLELSKRKKEFPRNYGTLPLYHQLLVVMIVNCYFWYGVVYSLHVATRTPIVRWDGSYLSLALQWVNSTERG